VDIIGVSAQPTASAPIGTRRCVFCCEEIRPGAVVCSHCGGNLAPLQMLADQHAALAVRLAALEQPIAAQRDAVRHAAAAKPAVAAPSQPHAALANELRWPHMADNIFLGLSVLLAAHWLATTLPVPNRTAFRLVALAVALPFGYRFQVNARTGTTGQVLAALAFGCVGTLSIGVLDAVLAGRAPIKAEDIIASLASIALSHYAGSALARFRQTRRERLAAAGAPREVSSEAADDSELLLHLEPAQIKTTAETLKAITDAATPLVAAMAALWAALGHLLFNRLRVSGTTKMPQVDQRICHQLHAIVPLLDELEPQQQPFEFILPREGPLHA